ncbi:related to 2-3-cyclic-nucleotide 3-phosphodiesterase [Rhynchosporium secalis]|uniref:Related to 2-3-cyclic-nucleotide 3-phosphodiesterase n=1 Tax=Rhynchosporium secalis TaxID=38038 RepID=A0A1E1MPB7_RHYSE|nr:related to 2-3-cyclic-nucleotide 3-phosphodiesterase [Rhynchosporium secalis]
MAPKNTWRNRERARAEAAEEERMVEASKRKERSEEPPQADTMQRDITTPIPAPLRVLEKYETKQEDNKSTEAEDNTREMIPSTRIFHNCSGIQRLPDGEGEPRNEDTMRTAIREEKERSGMNAIASAHGDREAYGPMPVSNGELYRHLILGTLKTPQSLSTMMVGDLSASQPRDENSAPKPFASSSKAEFIPTTCASTKPNAAANVLSISSPEVEVEVTTSNVPFTTRDIKPSILGIYGISGCGKSHLIKKLKDLLGEEDYAFHDGSGMIDAVVPGGLETFKTLPGEEQDRYRIQAIRRICDECAESGRVGVVAGHYMFWKSQYGLDDDDESGGEQVVWTSGDAECFTDMMYLSVQSQIVVEQCENDKTRKRLSLTRFELELWMAAERRELEKECGECGIGFALIGRDELQVVADMLKEMRKRPELLNLARTKKALDSIMAERDARLETMIVLDADRTLCAVDTGNLFWETFAANEKLRNPSQEPFKDPLKTIFSGPFGYSFNAFTQVDLLYGTVCSVDEFERICMIVAKKVIIHPEFKKLLRRVEEDSRIGAIIVTCGIRRVWEFVIELNGFSESVQVIGAGGHGSDYVVTAEVKAALVQKLQEEYGMHVWAFGDSPLDLPMLKQADEAIVVVVGEKGKRCRTMDKELESAIEDEGLVARQLLLPAHATPRLDSTRLPIFDIRQPHEMDSIFIRRVPLQIRHASPNSAELLQTPMRDGRISGVALQEVHKKVGWFLATELVTEVLPLEKYDIEHVQGGIAIGHRLKNEDKTLIIALMRGGEPMAKGVHEAFPLATFLHAHDPHDAAYYHLDGMENVLLVDSVINNGTTVVQFVKRIKELNAKTKIVVVAGVAQKASVAENGPLARVGRDGLTVIALRLSENKYTGKRGTDTGNRLFNTCRLD